MLRSPIISVTQDESGVGVSNDPGYLGGELLRRFSVVLDLRSRRVRFTPNASVSESFEVDLSGLELMTAPDDFTDIRVKTVRRGFPPARRASSPAIGS